MNTKKQELLHFQHFRKLLNYFQESGQSGQNLAGTGTGLENIGRIGRNRNRISGRTLTASLPIPPPSQYRLPPNTAYLPIPPPSQYRLPPNTAYLPIPPPSQYRLPPNTASLPIPPPSQYRLPPNTAAYFKFLIGIFKVILPPNTAVWEYHWFFASPKNGGIGRDDCIRNV